MSLSLARAERPGVAASLRGAAEAMLARQHGRFAPWLAVALGAGVLCYFERATEPGWQALWLVPGLIALALWLGRRVPLVGWAVGMATAGLLGFGVASWQAAGLPAPLDLPRGAVGLSGTVTAVEALPESRRVTLEGVRLNGGDALPRAIRLRLRASDAARPEPGDTIAVRALLREPPPPVAPGAWDFQRAAFFSGLGGSGTAIAPVVVTQGEERPFFAWLRTILETRIEAAIPGGAGAVAAALLTGSQAAIPPAEIAAMRDSGLAHLLSVSGLHMAIVIGVVFAVLRLAIALVPWVALRIPGKAIAAVGGLAAGIGYTLLTGSQVPMQRCLVMAGLVTLALVAGRRALTLRSIALAAAVVLLAAPAELLGPSFQMSFAAVLALIAGHEALKDRLSALRLGGGWRRRVALAVIGLALTSALAGAATAPFGLHHFGRLQIYGVAANAVAVPLTSFLVMPAGMVALALMPFGLEAPALWAMGQGVEAMLAVARVVAAWPEASPVLPPIPGPALAVAAFGFCWLALWRGGLRLAGVPVLAGALAAGLAQAPPDLLVSPDARLVALRTSDGVFVQELAGASAFAKEAMLRRMSAGTSRPLPLSGEVAGGALACTDTACRFRPRDGAEAVLLRTAPVPRGQRAAPPEPEALRAACGTAGLIISAEPIRPRCGSGESIDRFTVWRGGAQAAWLGQAVRVVADRDWRGDRPWVPARPLPGQPDSLPVAPRDGG
ncbi:ComEC/Rec2 family competence protein [Falsiroseomonas sp. HW251]|uniref:ComEC/Rec2 family competence protein n=1 Tax=Falsiroseomonas sp. HW251 TaxID=3390998 RepID=UPI003D3194FC